MLRMYSERYRYRRYDRNSCVVDSRIRRRAAKLKQHKELWDNCSMVKMPDTTVKVLKKQLSKQLQDSLVLSPYAVKMYSDEPDSFGIRCFNQGDGWLQEPKPMLLPYTLKEGQAEPCDPRYRDVVLVYNPITGGNGFRMVEDRL